MQIKILQAIKAHKDGKLEKAEVFYREVLKTQPRNLDVINNLGVLLSTLGRFDEAEANYRKSIELKPDYADAYYNLGNLLKKVNRINEAETCYNKVIELNQAYAKAHANLGIIQMELGNLDQAERSYKKVIKLEPANAVAHTNLGKIQMDLNKIDEALASQKKAIELKPNYDKAHYNLGEILVLMGQYRKAAEEFMLANLSIGKMALLKCWFQLDNQPNFSKLLDEMVNLGMNNAVIGSLISRSKTRYGINKQNPFCEDPLDYVFQTDLSKHYDFKDIFIKPLKKFFDDTSISNNMSQILLTNGTQTSGNLFLHKDEMISEIENIIHLEIEKYKAYFKDSEEGFLKNWPKSYFLRGWIIKMKNGGKLSPHMHEEGWLSGSIYINVPTKKNTNNGNLVVCIDDREDEVELYKKPPKIIDVITGSMCLFPSSLLHYTIPFKADEERIVLAFDVIPK